MQWPESVTVVEPGMVGKGKLTHANGRPCCAIGWRDKDLPIDCESADAFGGASYACAVALKGNEVYTPVVTSTNDYVLNRAERALVYNAAMAYLGYVVGQDPEAVKLANKAKRLAKGA